MTLLHSITNAQCVQGGIATENYTILNGISGMLRPGSITLLLGERQG